jgi:transcription elongation factor Elf1
MEKIIEKINCPLCNTKSLQHIKRFDTNHIVPSINHVSCTNCEYETSFNHFMNHLLLLEIAGKN